MTDKELKKLTRLQLLELLVEQGKELERQKARAERAEKKLRERNLLLGEAGSIAEAALRIQGVFEAAQAAADQYLDSVRGMCGIAVPQEEWKEYEEHERIRESKEAERKRSGQGNAGEGGRESLEESRQEESGESGQGNAEDSHRESPEESVQKNPEESRREQPEKGSQEEPEESVQENSEESSS